MNERPRSADAADQGERFDQLAWLWKRETMGHSNTHFIVNNDAFREIVAMGEDAMPHIFRKMENGENGLWWLLLERITGTRLTQGVEPVPGVRGWVKTDVPTLKAAWLEWGREREYLAENPAGPAEGEGDK